MAAVPAHCKEQKTSEDTGGLRNGTPVEDLSSDDSSGNVIMKNTIKSTANSNGSKSREMKMDSFQDGGTHQLNNSAVVEKVMYGSSVDRQRMSSDFPNYNQNSRDGGNEDYRNTPENFNHSSNTGYGGCERRVSGGNYTADQHGGQEITATASDATQNKLYAQYSQQQLKTFNPRGLNMGPPQRPGMAAMNPNQGQRIMSGQTISQQGGPTPTLNLLLQSPNPSQRYHNSFGDYSNNPSMSKTGMSDLNPASSQYPPSNSWGNRTAGPGNYSQPMPATMYRSQSGPVVDMMKRPYMTSGTDSSPSHSTHGHPQAYSHQYHQRSYSQSQGQNVSARLVGQSYSQQGAPQYVMQQDSPGSQVLGYEQRTHSTLSGYTQSQNQNQQQEVAGTSDELPSQEPSAGTTTPTSSASPAVPSTTSNSTSSNNIRCTTPGLRTRATPPTSQSQGQSPLRPAPSPTGSSISPSISPAIGQQQNIPMPPRPASSQSDTNVQNQMNQSSMAAQGYSQPMAPPTMYGNKMHQGMMASQMGSYSPRSTGHYSPGNYHCTQGTLGMQNYGSPNQNNTYSGNVTGYSVVGRMSGQTSVTGTQGYNAGPGATSSYMNSQYGTTGPPSSAGYGMNNMMPPPAQYPKGSAGPPGAAQAAAQAAVIAAASSASMRSPVYLRQHLQQKMYGGNYSNMQPQAGAQGFIPGTAMAGAAGPPTGMQDSSPMPPPTASTPSAQPLSQISAIPPTSMGLGNASNCDNASNSASVGAQGFTQTSAPSTGSPPTTVTQSIGSPLSTVPMTVSSPSEHSLGSHSLSGHQQTQSSQSQSRSHVVGHPQPPPIMDEGSQASNLSASSSLPDEHVDTSKGGKAVMSHPPTPNALPSPGAASMSSFHDEFDSVSSPSWPRTPASPRPDGMLKLYDMSDEPERRIFLDKLIMYNEERGNVISQCPTISKQPLDLFRLYICVKERGGFVDVTKAKQWKDVAGALGIGASSSAAYTLRKQYIKHLLPFECKFDRGGIDPQPIISQVEASSRKKSKGNNGQEPYSQSGSNQMMENYPSSGYGSPYPAQSSHGGPGMMANADYPSTTIGHPSYPDNLHHGGTVSNHLPSDNSMDPYNDELQSNQYQRPPNDTYGYNQASVPYPNSQSSMSGGTYGYTGSSLPQHEQYGDQYSSHPSNMMSSSNGNYGNRNIVQDPYGQPPGTFPPNRTVGQHTGSAQYPYQGHCEQERFDQTQTTPIQPPSQTSGMIPSNPDHTNYPPQRYPGSQAIPPSNNAYQNRTTGQYPNNQSSYTMCQQDTYRNPDVPTNFQNQMVCVQSVLAQRLFPKMSQNIQGYPPNQQGMYAQSGPPPNKVAPSSSSYQRDMYAMGPKRHLDFNKLPMTTQDQYHMGGYGQQQNQGLYGDRNQYSYRPTHNMSLAPNSGPQQGWPRDSQYRQYTNSVSQNQYHPGQRDGWDASRHGEGPPITHNNWPISYGNQQDSYPPHMGNVPLSIAGKMPYGRERVYIPPNKISQHPNVNLPHQYMSHQSRREIIFPSGTIESISPILSKRRRLTSKDVSPLEAWRLMMALKSGLLAETTWALDVLSVLLYDDNTVLYFGLNHLPGLLETLMEHYRRCLNVIFGLVEDLDIGQASLLEKFQKAKFQDNSVEKKEESRMKKKWFELKIDLPQNDDNTCEKLFTPMKINPQDKILLLETKNYTKRTRCGKIVRTKYDESLFLFDPNKEWDVYEGFNSGAEHWKIGGGEMILHIQTHFENSDNCLRFVRVMEDLVKKRNDDINTSETKTVNKILNCAKEPVVVLDRLCCTDNSESLSDQASESLPSEQSKKINEISVISEVIKEQTEETCEQKEDTILHPIKEEITYPYVREPAPKKRKHLEDLEEEAYNRDEPSLCVITEKQNSLMQRCLCISSLLRNLSFVPGNDNEMSKHANFLIVMGRLLQLHHTHVSRRPTQRHYDKEDDVDNSCNTDSCSSLTSDEEWWWDVMHLLRENTLVTLANITGQMDLGPYPEEISLPLFDGLLHWAVCPSSYAQDPLPTQPPYSVLSPLRLSLEALCKLSTLDSNVDLLLATPPWSRIEQLFGLLVRLLNRCEEQVLREFAVVLLSNLARADNTAARSILLQGSCIPHLITFVEQAEQSALQVANSQGINALRENPELMGTTLDMVRRAASTLRCLARVPENRTYFLQHQQRLLALVMSQILDQGVASIMADVLFECSQPESESELCNGTTA